MRFSISPARFTIGLTVAIAGACATGRHSGLDPNNTGVNIVRTDDSTRVTVRIENQGFADVDVYAIPTSGGIKTRLGTVTGHTTEILDVPRTLLFGLSELQFTIDPIGGGDATVSDKVIVQPGDEVDLLIPPS